MALHLWPIGKSPPTPKTMTKYRSKVLWLMEKMPTNACINKAKYSTGPKVSANRASTGASMISPMVPIRLSDKTAHVYFCGPLPFMAALKSILNSIGFTDDQLHYEVFGPTIDMPESH